MTIAKGRKILITGAAGNLGNAIATAFADPQNLIVLHFNSNRKKADKLAKEIEGFGVKVVLIKKDVSSAAGAEGLVRETFNKVGAINVLIHLVSSFERTPFGKIAEKKWNEVLDVNLRSAFFVAQEASKHMSKRGGSIVFMSDVAARSLYKGYIPYSIAKAGINAMTVGLAKALAPKIRVNAVAPYVVTRKGSGEKGLKKILNNTLLRRAQSAEEVARTIKLLCEDDCTMTGQIITIDGGRIIS